jgi:hypothetical protein
MTATNPVEPFLRMDLVQLAEAAGASYVARWTLHWCFRRVFDHGPTVLGWLLIIPMFCVLLMNWLPGNHWSGPISISVLNALLLRLSAVLPAGLPAVALAAVLPVALLWWTATRLFRGVEIPPPAAAARA